jgi:exopolysaccharide biosynthesis WecB/TagA/CpsF family protein
LCYWIAVGPEVPLNPDPIDRVSILQVPIPRLTRSAAVDLLDARLSSGETTAVCFADMSTLNLAANDSSFRDLIRRRFLILNDGAGVAWAARRRRLPFASSLGGTDLVPEFLAKVPAGTRVYVLGGEGSTAADAASTMSRAFPQARFVGSHHGFLDERSEGEVIGAIRTLKPAIVLVAMGNPIQVGFIARHLDDPALAGTLWFAVGGLLEYWAGRLRRAPEWARRVSLEWLFIVSQQPHKVPRYFLGIPRFIGRCLAADALGTHEIPDGGEFAPRDSGRPAAGIKRALRAAAAATGRLAGAGDPLGPRILCYHGVSPDPGDEWTVTPAALAAQMAWVASTRTPVSLDRIVAWMRGEADLPPKAMAVTFDDGYRDVLEHAAPILAAAGVPGAVFVCTALASAGPSAASRDYALLRPVLDWNGIRDLRDAGWTIGSHTRTHPVLSRLPGEAVRHELADSRSELSDRLGFDASLLAYPFGTPGTVSGKVRALAREAGYEAAFLAVSGGIAAGTDLFRIPRSKILGTDDVAVARSVVDGSLDPWSLVERTH